MPSTVFLFRGTDASDLQGLWVSDGTAAGTSELVVAGASARNNIEPGSLISYDGRLLFSGVATNYDSYLFVTDGTSAGTSEVATGLGGASLNFSGPVVYNGLVYFQGDGANNTYQLWVTDGTAAHTSELVVPTAPVNGYGLNPYDLTVVGTAAGSRIALAGYDSSGNIGLWISDGTAAGTTEIDAGLPGNPNGLVPTNIHPLTATTFLFEGEDGASHNQLFVSDGTAAGTSELTGIAGAPDPQSQLGTALLNGHVLFAGYTQADGTNLWTTDGTAAGTSELTGIGGGIVGLVPSLPVTFGDKVFFGGFDSSNENGIFITDGTAAGTTELVGVGNAPADFYTVTNGAGAVGNDVYFSAVDSNNVQALWVTDGTVAGTSEIGPIDGAYSGGVAPRDITALVPCYATGTRIRTARGDVAVEALRRGDHAITADGSRLPITWIGQRALDCTRHQDPRAVCPVRVAAGTFGPGLPGRDLLLSPDHALFIDGALVPVRYLVNGTGIRQERPARVTYWHVELPLHAVLLAEGLPAESYLETGQRACFANGSSPVRLHPDFTAQAREAGACAPYLIAGPALQAVRDRLQSPLPSAA